MVEQVYAWSLDILSALHFLHDRDPVIVHRDIKPSNLVITRDRRSLKLIDFGLSRTLPRGSDCLVDSSPAALVLTTRIGTLRYSAPEVFACDEKAGGVVYSEKADVFSAALIIWYLLTGRRPHSRESPFDRPALEPARRRWAGLAGLLERMWAHDAAERPSAGECLSELREMPLRAGCGTGMAGNGECRMQ